MGDSTLKGNVYGHPYKIAFLLYFLAFYAINHNTLLYFMKGIMIKCQIKLLPVFAQFAINI